MKVLSVVQHWQTRSALQGECLDHLGPVFSVTFAALINQLAAHKEREFEAEKVQHCALTVLSANVCLLCQAGEDKSEQLQSEEAVISFHIQPSF